MRLPHLPTVQPTSTLAIPPRTNSITANSLPTIPPQQKYEGKAVYTPARLGLEVAEWEALRDAISVRAHLDGERENEGTLDEARIEMMAWTRRSQIMFWA